MKNKPKQTKTAIKVTNGANKYATKTVGELLTPKLVKNAKNTHRQ